MTGGVYSCRLRHQSNAKVTGTRTSMIHDGDGLVCTPASPAIATQIASAYKESAIKRIVCWLISFLVSSCSDGLTVTRSQVAERQRDQNLKISGRPTRVAELESAVP